jgi:ring-1,2-phenylacetyl-CoA epoxidase subunit PaaD
VVNTIALAALDATRAWQVLDAVLDPEVPVLSVVELGIVRDVRVEGEHVEVTLTPTYSGCPATEVIADAVVQALRDAGAREVRVRTQLAPAWTTDWIAPAAAEKLRRYGIAPPHLTAAGGEQPLHFHPRVLADSVACPRCASTRTQQLSAFGATACKSLYRCIDCREPFEYFKPI